MANQKQQMQGLPNPYAQASGLPNPYALSSADAPSNKANEQEKLEDKKPIGNY
jgi:hypothetical protein